MYLQWLTIVTETATNIFFKKRSQSYALQSKDTASYIKLLSTYFF